jgi:hypothetical protein
VAAGILGGTGILPVIIGRLASRPYSLSYQSALGSDHYLIMAAKLLRAKYWTATNSGDVKTWIVGMNVGSPLWLVNNR